MGSNNSLNGSIIAAFSIAQSLKARTSSNSLQTGISISITRKASGSLGSPMHSPSLGSPMYSPSLIGSPMQSPSYTGSPTYSPSKVGPKNWRTTDMSGAYGPVLSRKSSNSGLRQPTPVSKGMLICGLNSPAEIPKPVVRHHNSTGIPTTPRAAKSIRLPQSGPRMATSAAKPRQVASADPLSPPTGELRKMSQSLRDTIRAAREAKQRKESVSTNGTTVNGLDGFDFGTQDPFNNPDIIIGQPGSDDEGSAVGDDEVEEVEGEKGMIKVGRSGVLDLSNQGLGELSAELFDTILGSPYTILLTNNLFTTIPSNVDHFASLTSINLSGNHFDADFLPQKLMLRSLDTLNLRNTGIESLEPLFRCLDAPKLIVLDISANRVCSIEGLRQAFPALMTLQASDNQVVEIPIESIDGVRSIDLSGNSIAVLPPQLALLENLRELKVQGNLFRVPRWQVLEKGTEAIMSWLHDRLPVEDGGVVEE